MTKWKGQFITITRASMKGFQSVCLVNFVQEKSSDMVHPSISNNHQHQHR